MIRYLAVLVLFLSTSQLLLAQCGCGPECNCGPGCRCGHDGGFKFTPPEHGASMGFTGFGINMASRVPLADMGGPAGTLGSAIWGWTDRTAPGGPREYALFGLSNGTSFVDITNPFAPVYVGRLPTVTGTSVWRELQTRGDYAFVVSDVNANHGMQIMDLKKLRNYSGTPITFSHDAHYVSGSQSGAFSNAHTIQINEATPFAYVFGSSTHNGGVHVVDISNPLNPTFVTGFSSVGYVHDGQSVIYNGPDVAHRGKEILFAANSKSSANTNDDAVQILDVSNKAAITILGSRSHDNARYIHQGRLTEDHRYFLVDDELDEVYDQSITKTHVYDVSDLDNPIYKGGWEHTNQNKIIDHNLFIKGNLVFSSNYTRGLRVLNIDDLGATGGPQMRELAWFDTYPADDAEKSFNGQWGNYPFFDSGSIIVGDRQNGLFVLQLAFVPEPSTYALMGLAVVVAAGGYWHWRKKRSSLMNEVV